MIGKLGSRILATGAVAAAMCCARGYAVPISVATVGPYAATPTAGMTISNAVSNTAPNGLTLATFQLLMPTAFAANTGGVINAEDQSAGGTIPGVWRNNNTNYGDGVANQITATYGVGQGSSVGIYRTDLDPTSSAPVGINGNNNNAFVASGTSYIGVAGPGSPVNLAFTKGLSALGLTEVPRSALRNVTLTAVLDNASTIVGSTEQITAANAPGAIFWGFIAPAGRTIVGLNITSVDGGGVGQFSRFDDLGFVVAAIPEPTSLGLLGMACVGLVLRRRRS